jgi:hypothetical protein
MLIYVDQISERLIYTFDFVFKERNIKYNLTNDWLTFEKSTDLKFIYSQKEEDKYLKINNSTMLFDEVILKYTIEKSFFYEQECLSFNRITDPFASIFYILSRMEEYTVKIRDKHDRFPAKESVLFKYLWLDKAICDHWAVSILSFLEAHLNIKFEIHNHKTQIIPTFDIDNTFAFKWKEGWRKYLGLAKDYYKKDNLRIQARKEYNEGKINDPYDSYDTILEVKNKGFDVKMFWLLGDYARYDKNISSNDIRHQRHIRALSKLLEIGLHPSYKSNENPHKLKNEHQLLEKIIGRKVTCSRQHFLKLSFPYTYQNLIEQGFTDDFTMGYAEEVGFRAGTARSFCFFDLTKNQKSNLIIHPFVYMDGTLNEYKKWTPSQSMNVISNLFNEVKRYGGNFIFLWHNETITDFGKWKGWKQVFDFTLRLT